LDNKNNKKDFPTTSTEEEPAPVGTYQGRIVEQRYWCSDVCPDNGILYLAYQEPIEPQACKDMGSYPVSKYGWGEQYLGCSPVKNKYSE